jgi:NAD(P)-dependent dehydrogenase (short-subunit alcohol dehydrogenase family)
MAPLRLAAAFTPHVARSDLKRIVAISSGAGSVSNTKFGDDYAYRSSKAGLNAVMRILSFELAPQGITILSIGPGHTITDMGGPDARFTAEDSVTRVRAVIAGLSFADNGRYVSRDGEDIPW